MNTMTSCRRKSWKEVVTTASDPKEVTSCKHHCMSSHISKDCESQSMTRRSHSGVKQLPNPDTRRSKVSKHVHFASSDKDIIREVTVDDIKNSWLDTDISGAIEAIENESRGMIVSFGHTGRFTSSDINMGNVRKEFMVRIQERRLINEMLEQRTMLRQSVFDEQARQRREGIVDVAEMCAVASKESQWGVELAKSSWWLSRS